MTAKGWVRFATSPEVDLPTTTLPDLSLVLAGSSFEFRRPDSAKLISVVAASLHAPALLSSALGAMRAVVANDWTIVEELNRLPLELKLS